MKSFGALLTLQLMMMMMMVAVMNEEMKNLGLKKTNHYTLFNMRMTRTRCNDVLFIPLRWHFLASMLRYKYPYSCLCVTSEHRTLMRLTRENLHASLCPSLGFLTADRCPASDLHPHHHILDWNYIISK